MQEKIKQVIISNLEVYLNEHLKKIPEDKKEIAKEYFYKDIEKITNYCYENFGKLLSEEFIKGLHKSLYPDGYIQKTKDENGNEIIWMIPGEYKKIKIVAKENVNKDIYESVENVEKSLKKLIDDFNVNMSKAISISEKKDLIFLFAVDFVSIHPFGDGNGRVDGILIDLLCLKYDVDLLGLVRIYKNNKQAFISLLNTVRNTKKIKYMYDFIENHKN